ncbi:aminoglycoside phosphotransferase family protein [Streptomyces sp. XM83C]|uniref:Phosphotransferase family protein n=1 Tax=Streptomyces thermocoprophilus TaxID=78356 RepID=A0ABV5VJ76_9ACTN|nr:aminoglycoside phosphotransferase family protein [Streptomyces sp. XM83C]MCK1822915.1 aminoglycoside phosphotransferase family protein [Streptomyces sp. XM83C]
MSHPLPRRAQLSLVRRFAEARLRSRDGVVVSGHHNRNVIAPLRQPLALLLGIRSGRTLAKFRTPLPTIEVVPRIWPREAQVLKVVGDRLHGQVPRCLADFGDWSLHDYLPGRSLAQEIPEGPLGPRVRRQLAEFFARLAAVPREALPPLPDDWPADGDSRGFLARLARFTEERVHRPNRSRFGELFDAVGIPRDAMERFMGAVPSLTGRPFVLLHTDVHRANVVVTHGPDGERLSVIDWELALYGDPLHELATHLVRTDYDKAEQEEMVRCWSETMKRSGRPDLTVGLDRDLPVYLGFEYAQSVYPDVMRAALSLPDDPGAPDLARAAARVTRAMGRAREPLGLVERPRDDTEVAQALWAWRREDRERTEERAPTDSPGGAAGHNPPAGHTRTRDRGRAGAGRRTTRPAPPVEPPLALEPAPTGAPAPPDEQAEKRKELRHGG